MSVTYFKRFRMEISLDGRNFGLIPPTACYRLHAWDPAMVQEHAAAKYRSFCDEIDANVFPCLGDSDGCHRLMREISRKGGFLSESTWLLSWQNSPGEPLEFCGTIQGIRDRHGYGAVQNLGVAPGHRDQGLGRLLLYKALTGFQDVGLRRAYLEVTAQNSAAIRLYERAGFIRTRTVYKAVEADDNTLHV